MADDLNAPVQTDISAMNGPDPFADFLSPSAPAPQQAPALLNQPAGDDPFAQFLAPNPEDETSGLGAFARGAERSALPAAGGLAAMGAGAELGAAVGAGVGGPVGAGVGGIAGGLAGAIGGSMAVQAVQDFALQALPPNWVDFMGLDQKQQELDQTYHPTETFLGGLVPYALTMKPSLNMATAALPANATAYQRIVANPMTARLFSGAINGGMELGQEVVQGQQPNWTNVGIATGFGVIFNRNNRIGERITEAGAAPVRRAAGIPGPTIEAAKALTPVAEEKPVTVAQAGDTSVMGPGITEDVFMGSHQASPEAAMAVQETARTEKSATTAPDAPDVHTVARRIEPELFAHYDDLVQQRDDLRAHLAQIASPNDEAISAAQTNVETLQAQLDQHLADRGGYAGGPQARTLKAQIRDAQNQVDALAARRDAFAAGEGADTPEMTAIRQKIMDTDFAMRDIAPQISAANRRAADWAQSEVIEPDVAPEVPVVAENSTTDAAQPAIGAEEPGPGAAPSLSVQEQVAAIAEDVTRQLIAAGRPEAEARAAGQLLGQRYKTRAGRFAGALGQPLDLYHREGADIRQGGRRAAVSDLVDMPEAAPEPVAIASNPSDVWDSFIADRQEKTKAVLPGSYNATTSKGGAKLRAKATQKWDIGEVVDAGFVKNILVVAKNDDGTTTLVGKPDADGMSQSYIAKSHSGVSKAEKVNFLEATKSARGPVTELAQNKPNELFQTAPAPDTPEFANWFKDSKVVDEDGAPLVVYRSNAVQSVLSGKPPIPETTVDGLRGNAKLLANLFQGETFRTKGLSGFDAPTQRIMLHSMLSFGDNPEVLKAVVKLVPVDVVNMLAARNLPPESLFRDMAVLKDVLSINSDDTIARAVDVSNLIDMARSLGASVTSMATKGTLPTDLIPAGVLGGASEGAPASGANHGYLAVSAHDGNLLDFKPTDNGNGGTGTFDPNDPRILMQQQRGSITLRENRKPLIKLFADANASTFLHESGHQWLEEMMRDAIHEAAPQSIRDDMSTVRQWLNLEGDKIATKQHEKFARGFEQYVREGVAPSPTLARVFAQFKSWLMDIYASIKGLGTPISEDVRGVFDRMLAEDPQRTVIAPEREGASGMASLHETESATTHPREAEPAMDRVVAERDRYIAEQSPEVQNELAIAEAEQRTADAAANAGSETGIGPDGSAEVVALGGESEPIPAGGAGGGEPGAQLGGGGATGTEGAGLPAGSGTGAGDAAGLRPQRSEPAGAAGSKQPLSPEPTAVFGPDDSKFTDKAGNIRIENLTTNEDVAQAIRDSAAENNNFIGDRRGVITDGQVLDLADALGMDAAQLDQRKIGAAFNAEQIMAARKLLVESATDLSAIMKRAATSGSDADVMLYAQAKDRHNMIQAQVSGITAEAGRALRAFRSIAGQETALGVDQFLRTATGKTLFQLKEEIKLGALIDTPAKVSKFARDAQKRDFASMAVEYWINGLVSGPKTQVTNVVGNTIMGLQVMGPETAAAAAIGAMRKALGREGSTVKLGEVAAHMRAAAKALPSSLLAAGDAIRTGRGIALPGEDVKPLPYQPGSEFAHSASLNENATYADIAPALFGGVRGILDGIVAIGTLVKTGGDKSAPLIGRRFSPLGSIPDIAVRGTTVLPVGSAIRLPTRFLAAGDSFFRSMLYSMEKNGQAYRMATEEGLTGTAFDARIADLRQNPTPELMESSRSIASDTVFMGRSSEFISALSRLANTNIMGLPLLKFVTPFISTPASIIEQAALRRTPLGAFSPEIRADLMGKNGNVAQDTAMARMLVGTAYAIAFGTLAARGLITGSGPTDPNAAAAWRQAGNQPHSMRIGDTWYDMRALGPLGLLAGMSADTYDVSHAAETGDLAGAAASLQHAFMQNILDASWMTGPSDLIQALEDPGRYGSSYVSKFLSSFVPFSGAMGQISRATDPFSRQARGIIDSIRAKVPGLSESLMPRRDIWGEPMPQQSTLGPSLVSSVYTTDAARDPVNLAFQQSNYWPGAVDRKIRGVTLTDQQYDEFATIAGRMLKQRLQVIVGSPTWNNWDAPTRHDVISEIVRQSRETARGYMFARHQDLVQQAVAAKLAPLQQRGN